ncbi:MAG: hypothetical protein ACE37D_02845 [Pseudomonadales bacterium]|jgi:hypothetical protein
MIKTCANVLFGLVLLGGCASQSDKTAANQTLQAYIGQSIADAEETFGKPSRVYDMQDGTWEYIWSSASGGVAGAGLMGVQVASGNKKSCNRVLIANKSKVVLGYRLEGTCRR